MTPCVFPGIVATVDWKSLLGMTKQALSRHRGTPFDRVGKEIKYAPHLLPILSEFESPGATLQDRSPHNNEHLHYGFCVVCDKDTYIELLSCSRLVCTYTQERDFILIIISGNLRDWSDLIIEMERDVYSSNVRHIVSEIRKYLESQEFRITPSQRLLK